MARIVLFIAIIFNLNCLTAPEFKECSGDAVILLYQRVIMFLHQFLVLIKLTTTFIIISFSSGLLSAIISVSATRALSAMRFEPSFRYRIRFFSRNQTNKKAAIRLLPSEKE